MDFLPIAVLIVFVLLGGIIAVIADELGRRIGKRRLTLHRRIRPKRTAQILTFFSGMMITLITMLLIGLSSSDMRTLLLRGRKAIEDLRAQNETYRKGNDDLREEQSKLIRRQNDLTKLNDALTRDVADDQNKIAAAETKLNDAKTKADRAAQQYALLQTKSAGIQSRLNSVNRQLTNVNSDLADRKKELFAKQKEYKALQASYKWVYKDQQDLLRQNQNLITQKSDLEKQLNATKQDIDTAKGEIKDLNAQKLELQQQKQNVQNDLDQLQQQLSAVKTTLSQSQFALGSSIERTRFRPLVFSVQEELARISIPAHTSKAQVMEKIEDGLVMARDVAKSRGVQEADLHIQPDAQDHQISVEAQKDSVASELAGSDEDQVLIVYSWANAFAGENMILALTDKPNPIVYQQGQTLAEVWVDGRKDATDILQTLNGLGIKIRERALKDKMIPVQKGDMALGTVSPSDIVKLYNDIRTSQANVRVRAVTRRQIRAADPLALDFKVK